MNKTDAAQPPTAAAGSDIAELTAQVFELRVLMATALAYGLGDSTWRHKTGVIREELETADRHRREGWVDA